MANCSSRLLDDLEVLSIAYPLTLSEDFQWLIVHNFKLPPDYNYQSIDVLVELPKDYPCTPPGVATRIYLSKKLRFKNRMPKHLHEGTNPGWGDWAWFCYEKIDWNPVRDDLIKLMEMIRADLTDTEKK